MKKTILFLGLLMMLAVPMVVAAGDVTHAFENSTGTRLLNITSVGDLQVTQDVYARNFYGNATGMTFPTCAEGEVLTYNGTDLYCESTSGVWTTVDGEYIHPTDGANVSIRDGAYFQVKETGNIYSLMDVLPSSNTTTIREKLVFEDFLGNTMFSLNAEAVAGISAGGADPNLNVFYFQNPDTYFGLPSTLGGKASGNITIFSDASDATALTYVDDNTLNFGATTDVTFNNGLVAEKDIEMASGANVTFDDGGSISSNAGVMTFRSGI